MLNHSNDEVVVMPILNDKQIANFWKKVNMPEDKSLCWEWKGYMNEKGYGRMDINTKENGMKTYYSHRLAYFLQYGVDPLNKLICHSCDNPKCQNGNHLFIGTIQDNNADAAKKSRSLIVEGENNIKAKLTKETVKNILYDYYINKIGIKELSKKYNASGGNIRHIVAGESWQNIDDKIKSLIVKMPKKFTKKVLNVEQKSEVLELFKKNIAPKDLAKMFLVSKSQIYKILSYGNPKHLLPKTG